jgi:XXXCH domain-containing protein
MVRRAFVPLALVAVMLASGACNNARDSIPDISEQPSEVVKGARDPGTRKRSPIKEIMAKLTMGPRSLTPLIGEELKTDPPPWETIQSQAKEFVSLSSSMSKYDPPKGSKESWLKVTSEYAESAAALEKAVQAKDREAALAAQDSLANSCIACHQEHRRMGAGMGK